MLFLFNAGATELDNFYPVRPECEADVPKTHFKPRAGKTLSERRWKAAFSLDGHLDIAKVLRRIQRGGIHPCIKGAVWEFLLGCYDPNSTFEERRILKESRWKKYSKWKDECRNMIPVIGSGKYVTTPVISEDDQDSSSDQKVHQWKLILHQIGLDVARTDRTLVFYESELNQAKLSDILAVYAWVDNNIGYVQGMNDICSPIVILLEDEADCFWCFERAMRRMRDNFKCSSTSMGVQSQLCTLSQIIKTVDPKLHQHLEDLDGGEYLFAFRMLMVLFRREFSFADSLYLWEMMWAMEYHPNIFSMYEETEPGSGNSIASPIDNKLLKQCGKFHKMNVKSGQADQISHFSVFLVASLIETKQKRFLKEAKGLDDIVQILGDVTGNLDAKKACREALKIHLKYLNKDWLHVCLFSKYMTELIIESVKVGTK